MVSPRISIITPTHNRREALLRAVASVIAQTEDNFEHIVVDDSSTDGTDEVFAAWTDNRLTYVHLDRWVGANAVRNRGIELARAPIVTFLDSDDQFLPHRLASTLELFDTNPNLTLIISSFRTVKSEKSTMSINPHGYIPAKILERALIAMTLFIAGSAITVRRRVCQAVGCFDPDLLRLQDRDLLLRLARHSGALLISDPDWLKHVSSDSISNQPTDYVKAYSAMLAKNPHIGEQHSELVKYMIARRILEHAIRGRLSTAMREYQINRKSPYLGFSVFELACGFYLGKSLRKATRREVAAAIQPYPASLAVSDKKP